jgi:excinuclease ABC subunit A
MTRRRCGVQITSSISSGRGSHGGEVVVQGTLAEIQAHSRSETGRCLRAPMCHPTRNERRSLGDVEQWIEIRGAHANNLKNVDARFPVNRLSVITGISGSGKSTLMRSVLLPAIKDQLAKKKRRDA